VGLRRLAAKPGMAPVLAVIKLFSENTLACLKAPGPRAAPVRLTVDQPVMAQQQPRHKPNRPEYDQEYTGLLHERTMALRAVMSQLEVPANELAARILVPSLEMSIVELEKVCKEIKAAQRQGKIAKPEESTRSNVELESAKERLPQLLKRLAALPGVPLHLLPAESRLHKLGLIDESEMYLKLAMDEQGGPPRPAGNGAAPRRGGAANPGALDFALNKLKSESSYDQGYRELLTLEVDENRKGEVLEAMEKTAEVLRIGLNDDCFRVFKKWATKPEDRERFGKLTEAFLRDRSIREEVLEYISKNKIAAAAPEVARLLTEHRFERLSIARVLIAIGTPAEKPTLEFVNDLDPEVRQMAIEVLAKVGTDESLPALRKLLTDRHVGLSAKQAMQQINNRKVKQSLPDKPGSP
jgi:hypothetical protein